MKRLSMFFKVLSFNMFLLFSTLLFFALSKISGQLWARVLFITFLTIFYHFSMRLCVGEFVNFMFKNKMFNLNFPLFRIHRFELKLFNKLGVKRWKNKAITARPEFFDVSKVPMEDLLLNMVKAELIHEIIIALSFIPLLFIIPFGVPAVFAATSIFGALVDLKYVIIQRYNRPRVIRIISRTKH